MSEDNSERGAGGELHYREAAGMGETVGEARWVALRKLERQVPNLDKDRVEYVVVREGQRGLLGVGFEESEVIARAAVSEPTTPPSPALVRAEESGPPPPASDEPEARFVVDLLQRISTALQVDARVEVAGRGEDTITASFEGSDLGVLIGRRGKTIDAIEHIVSAATSRRAGRRIELTVDAARYRVRRERMLATIAENAARDARRTGKPVPLEPMSAPERKIIHLYLRDTEGIETQSEGIEPHRCVVVRPVRA
ncbi:MAG: KH domain-containing protein [Actinomycetia bacterium]|nr:KH domain-containing protein [Actinomycetes bacterium]